MPKERQNHSKAWTPQETRELRRLADGNTPTRVIGVKMGRTPDAVRSKAADKNISLRPNNQSPYGTGGRGRKG
jgi:hypothetical protein